MNRSKFESRRSRVLNRIQELQMRLRDAEDELEILCEVERTKDRKTRVRRAPDGRYEYVSQYRHNHPRT